MLEMVSGQPGTMLDVGSGKGYWVRKAVEAGYRVTACDLTNTLRDVECEFVQGDIGNLPFEDGQFDVVTCSHTLEHIVELDRAIAELKRVARKQLIIVVPCQRYNYLTPDGHVNFFPFREKLLFHLGEPGADCRKLGGDWLARIRFD